MKAKQNVLAIDGPSGSGKSTVAKQLSHDLNLVYIDTGAMFRAIGYTLDQHGIDLKKNELSPADEKKITKTLDSIKFEYIPQNNLCIKVDNVDLTDIIREHRVSELASLVSKIPVVRNYLALEQRKLAGKAACVLDGRDIGTVIFPQARCKIFLTADPNERAQRRFEELQGRGEEEIDFEQILKDIKIRDERDINRSIAPLKKADDAFEIDTSKMTIDEVVDKIRQIYLSS
ncbi:MAG: (d)CMP kinase [Bacteriovoracaceae bacterium]|nr:(d)CMP kinase [Bacteriovoracaceae bacterium]